MAIKDKYYNPDRFRSVKNLDSLYVTRTRKPNVIIGDTQDIRTCTRLYRYAVVHNWKSQWHSRYPDGYITFDGGNKYDRKRFTIYGKPAFIFLVTSDTEIIFQKNTTKEKIIGMLEMKSDEELGVVCQTAGLQCKRWPLDSVQRYILDQLETMSLRELHDFAALMGGAASSAGPEGPPKAAQG